MQFPGQAKPAVGIIYQTSMSRPDAALALAMLHGYAGKREARLSAVAVTSAGLAAAQFCDSLARFYSSLGPPPDSNRMLPVGLSADPPLPPDLPMVKAVVDRRNEKGEPQYARSINDITDTSEVLALIRNALTAEAPGNGVMILGTPATHLTRLLGMPGMAALITAKVKTLVISHGPQDAAAAKQLIAEWPTPVVLCGKDVGDALPYPAASIEKDFAWAPAHPVADAYRAFKQGSYDAPSWDMAAMLYAVHPDAGFFQLSEPGTIEALDTGWRFTPSAAGKHRRLIADPAQKEKIIQAYIEIASAKPVAPRRRQRPAQDAQIAPPKAAEVKPGEAKPGDAKPAEAKPAEAKPL